MFISCISYFLLLALKGLWPWMTYRDFFWPFLFQGENETAPFGFFSYFIGIVWPLARRFWPPFLSLLRRHRHITAQGSQNGFKSKALEWEPSVLFLGITTAWLKAPQLTSFQLLISTILLFVFLFHRRLCCSSSVSVDRKVNPKVKAILDTIFAHYPSCKCTSLIEILFYLCLCSGW